MMKFILAAFAALPLALTGATQVAARAEPPQQPVADGVIAKVGDQPISFNQINTMLNSSAVVGLSVPALGTPERDTARIMVLDKLISANLIYLDALKQGRDADPTYQRELSEFSSGMLAGLYIQRHLVGAIEISEDEIQAFHKEFFKEGTELTEELRTQIEASLRSREVQARVAAQRERLRDGIEVVVHEQAFLTAGDTARDEAQTIAQVGDEAITWGEMKDRLIAAGKGAVIRDPLAMEDEARRTVLEAEIDTRIMAQKARAAGLDQDPVFLARVAEYQKSRLINLHRAQLAADMEPSEAELKSYYEANRDKIHLREMRKVQEVVLETEEAAGAIKAKLGQDELTMFQAAAEHSIAPGAKQNLGEIGWVEQGRAQSALDEVIFALGPDEIGGPVQSTAGWHLVRVLDVQDAQFSDFEEEATRQRTRRRFIHERLDAYVVDLRKNRFSVEVYQERMIQLAQQEADMVKTLTEKAEQPGSVTQERIQELRKFMQPGG